MPMSRRSKNTLVEIAPLRIEDIIPDGSTFLHTT